MAEQRCISPGTVLTRTRISAKCQSRPFHSKIHFRLETNEQQQRTKGPPCTTGRPGGRLPEGTSFSPHPSFGLNKPPSGLDIGVGVLQYSVIVWSVPPKQAWEQPQGGDSDNDQAARDRQPWAAFADWFLTTQTFLPAEILVKSS